MVVRRGGSSSTPRDALVGPHPQARAIGVSFEETLEEVRRKGVYVGNPVARQVASMDRVEERGRALERFEMDADRKTLLVFGGSLGARRINSAAVGLAEVWGPRSDRQVLHITGRAQQPTPVDASTGLIYRQIPYVDRMVEAYALADLALCRGGATTVAELTVTGVPSVIVPYPYHRDRQQERHGRVLEAAGAAVVLDDARTTAEEVARIADSLLEDDAKLDAMRQAATSLGRPDAAERLCRVVRGVGS